MPLAKYLSKPYHSDLEKARSIYAWVIQNIDYDSYRGRLIANKRKNQKLQQLPQKDHILTTRVGVCEDIANLYQELATLAGLNVQVIDGWTNVGVGRRTMETSHRWLAVKMANSWEYVDPTWGIGETARAVFENVSANGRYSMEMKKRLKDKKTYEPRATRRVSDKWFLTDKDEMIKTHFPENEFWQLQKEKLTREEFITKKRKKKK